jgi:hypothetical protein
MFFNKNSQLNTAGSEVFAGDDSFMIELQPTDLAQISGGYGHGGGCHKPKEKPHWEKCATPAPCPPPAKCPPVKCPPPVVVHCPPAPCRPC